MPLYARYDADLHAKQLSSDLYTTNIGSLYNNMINSYIGYECEHHKLACPLGDVKKNGMKLEILDVQLSDHTTIYNNLAFIYW